MNLRDTLITAFTGALLGWLLKMASDKLSGWHAERKLINRVIYELYLLLSHVDGLLNLYYIWKALEDSDSWSTSGTWQRSFQNAKDVPASSEIRSVAASLAELNPQLSFTLVTLVSALDKVFELAATAHEDPNLSASAKSIKTLLEGLRAGVQATVSDLLAMRRFVRRRLSEKTLSLTANRNYVVEKAVMRGKRELVPEPVPQEPIEDRGALP